MTGRLTLVLPHPSRDAVWTLRGGDARPRLPSVVGEPRHCRDVTGVARLFRPALGVDLRVLRCLDFAIDQIRGGTETVFEAEAPDLAAAAARGTWMSVDRQLAETPAADRDHRALCAWQARRLSPDATGDREAWTRPGWHDEAGRVAGEWLARRGIETRGSWQQVTTSACGCLLRIETSRGDVYFKAGPAAVAHEAACAEVIAARLPDFVPEVFAADRARGWLLMAGVEGPTLTDCSDVATWCDALGRLADLQIASLRHVDAFRAAGVPDYTMARLSRAIATEVPDHLLPRAAAAGDLPPAECDAARRVLPALAAQCRALAACGVPPALEHGDCHPHNIIISPRGCVLLDWSECSIAHPFFSAAALLAYVEYLRPDLRGAGTRLLDAYLDRWTAVVDRATVRRAWRLAPPLAALHYALSQHHALVQLGSRLPPWERRELQAGLRECVRAACGAPRQVRTIAQAR